MKYNKLISFVCGKNCEGMGLQSSNSPQWLSEWLTFTVRELEKEHNVNSKDLVIINIMDVEPEDVENVSQFVSSQKSKLQERDKK